MSAGSRLRVMGSFAPHLVGDCVGHVSLLSHTQSYHISVSYLSVIVLFMCYHIHNHIILSFIIHDLRI